MSLRFQLALLGKARAGRHRRIRRLFPAMQGSYSVCDVGDEGGGLGEDLRRLKHALLYPAGRTPLRVAPYPPPKWASAARRSHNAGLVTGSARRPSPRAEFRHIEPVSVGFEPCLLHHTRILKIGDQRLARDFGRMSPTMQKIAPQRFRNISLTSGNVAPISASRTSPTETGLVGCRSRTRTQKCHFEKRPLKCRMDSR
jgi:hypothetical protein